MMDLGLLKGQSSCFMDAHIRSGFLKTAENISARRRKKLLYAPPNEARKRD